MLGAVDRLTGVRRVVVIGATGAGKTTLARDIAGRLNVPFTDFDELFWKPGWVQADREDFLESIAAIAARPGWTVSGNYLESAGPVTWRRADTIVWLDLPRRVSVARMVVRVVRDVRSGRELWPGCRQTIGTAVRTGLVGQAWGQTRRLRQRIPEFAEQWVADGIEVVRLTHTREVARWFAGVGS